MESGETYDNKGLAEQQNSWKGVSSPQPGTPKQQAGQLPPVYFNTTDNPAAGAPSPSNYTQYQKSPSVPQGEGSSAPPYLDAYQYAPSPGSGRMMQHPQGVYPGGARWPGPNSPAPQHSAYLPHDRSRYARPPYPSYDPSKPYGVQPAYGNQPPTSQHTPWSGASHPQTHPGYADASRLPRHIQADIAGPVVPAGLQVLQANNNNAALMQHQHTPMLVPNPHYNQNKAQGQTPHPVVTPKNPTPQPSDDQRQNHPKAPVPQSSQVKNSMAPNAAPPPEYYPSYPPHAQQNTLGPMHHSVGMASPGVAPYPANPATPGSTKSKGRGNKCYQCPKCVKVFRRGDHLKRHLLSVHDHEHPYQCGECGKGFASVPTLTKHAKSLHIGSLTKGLMCLRCQLTFKNIMDLEVHATSLHVQEDELYMQNINTSSKQHLCNACSKSFSSAANLKRHMQLLHRTKDETKLFCRECGKGFSRSDNLQKHMERVHGGNFNGMLDGEDHDDTESVTQSETESRGPSADTDESSTSAPPSKQWNFPIHSQSGPGTISPAVAEDTQVRAPQPAGCQVQYSQVNTVPQPPATQIAPSQHPPMTAAFTMPPTSTTMSQPAAPQAPPPRVSQTATNPSNAASSQGGLVTTKPQEQMHRAPKTQEAQQAIFAVGRDMPTMLPQQIEPKSVSEALSMAMKALSDFDYEVPGCETYPGYPSNITSGEDLQHNPGYVYQSYPYLPRMENGRNGTPNNTRPPAGGTVLPPYSNSNYSQQGGNFLMTMPPPPGVTTAGHLPSAMVAGGQVVPQLSRLLQGGGGGVNSPTIMNDNNNSNLTAQVQVDGFMEHATKPKNNSKKRSNRAQKCDNSTISLEFTEKMGTPELQKGDGEATTLECNVCNTSYESIDSLMQHIEMTHLKKNPHECCICNKKFAQAGNVKRHIRFVHLRERPFRCKDCSSTFDRLCYLQRHMRSHLQPDDGSQDFDHLKPCNCPECGKRCLTAHHLRGHMQRKHFAKNKQNYGQFLMKYRHLEAIGAGPGAITNPNRGRRGGRKKKNTKSIKNEETLPNRNENELPYSSKVPFSSIQPNALSPSPLPVVAPSTPAGHMMYTLPQQSYCDAQIQYKMVPNQGEVVYNGAYPAINGSVQMAKGFNNGVIMPLSESHIGATESTLRRLPMICLPPSNLPSGYINGFSGVKDVQKKERKKRAKSIKRRKRRDKARRKLLPFRCRRCIHVSFSSLSLLKSHMSVVHHHQLKRHVCLACGSSFVSNRRLRTHIFETHRATGSMRQHRKPTRLIPPTPESATPSPPEITGSHYQAIPLYSNTIPMTYSTMNNVNMISYIPAPNQYQYNTGAAAMVSASVQPGYNNPGHHFPAPLHLVQT